MSSRPFGTIRGVRALRGSHPIFTLPEAATGVLTLQNSCVFEALRGEASNFAVGFGMKHSTVHGMVLPADEITEKS